MLQASLHGRCCCQGSESLELPWLLLLSSPDDHHSGGVRGGQQAFVAVEAHIQDRPAVALQLVNNGLSVALNVEKVDAHILTACDNTGSLSEGHERTEDAVQWLGSVLNGETPLQQ